MINIFDMNYEVIVVGAGPAGSTTAKYLSEKGVKVLLLDKSKFPREKPCGGGIPIRVLKIFKYLERSRFVDRSINLKQTSQDAFYISIHDIIGLMKSDAQDGSRDIFTHTR